jgi:tRNA threonylcarbamoyladenosine biosynthesis protein TsaB
MALILCIDTSTTHASVALAKDTELLCLKTNHNPKDHAAFLQPAIYEIAKETGISLSQLDAIAVTSGPGSYTGLRVGFASAKGFCYALNKPLITISTTEVMAQAAVSFVTQNNIAANNFLFCPMIDARRMEVFTAVYFFDLKEKIKKHALILTENSFEELLQFHDIVFFGNGAEKWKVVCKNQHAHFQDIQWNAADMITIAYRQLSDNSFMSLAYSIPEYLKDFHSAVNK